MLRVNPDASYGGDVIVEGPSKRLVLTKIPKRIDGKLLVGYKSVKLVELFVSPDYARAFKSDRVTMTNRKGQTEFSLEIVFDDGDLGDLVFGEEFWKGVEALKGVDAVLEIVEGGSEEREEGWEFDMFPDTVLAPSMIGKKAKKKGSRSSEHNLAIADGSPRQIKFEPPISKAGHRLIERLRKEYHLEGGWTRTRAAFILSHRRDDEKVTSALDALHEELENWPATTSEPFELIRVTFPSRNDRLPSGHLGEEGKEEEVGDEEVGTQLTGEGGEGYEGLDGGADGKTDDGAGEVDSGQIDGANGSGEASLPPSSLPTEKGKSKRSISDDAEEPTAKRRATGGGSGEGVGRE
ncbi:hypothetical protein HDV00_007109 [Rhizophlyctis rosea]|nr:hypothetical protein HDV00_007109 [Rhizophlyctis rosea]